MNFICAVCVNMIMHNFWSIHTIMNARLYGIICML